MSSLIEELQRDAMNQDVSVTVLLQKCLVVATKLEIDEFASWARLELDGYKDTKVPVYRVVYGQPQVFNPYRGHQPLYFGDPKLTKCFSRMHFNQPIGELEHVLRQADKMGSDSLNISYAPSVEKMLMGKIEFHLQPSLSVNASQVQKIIDAIRKAVLEWSLKLENDGIIGEGITFSKEEKHKAQTVTYHIKNYIHGDFKSSQIQIETVDSTQKLSIQEFDILRIKEVIRALKSSVEELGLSGESKAEFFQKFILWNHKRIHQDQRIQ